MKNSQLYLLLAVIYQVNQMWIGMIAFLILAVMISARESDK